MLGIKVRENEPFESALRRFKKQCEKAGIISELRKRQFYEKPGIKRKKRRLQHEKGPPNCSALSDSNTILETKWSYE